MAIKLSEYLARKNLVLAGKTINLSKLEDILSDAQKEDSPLYSDVIPAPRGKITFDGRGQNLKLSASGSKRIPDYIIYEEGAFETYLLGVPELLISRTVSEDDLMGMGREERKAYLQSLSLPVSKPEKIVSSSKRGTPYAAQYSRVRVRELEATGVTKAEAKEKAKAEWKAKTPAEQANFSAQLDAKNNKAEIIPSDLPTPPIAKKPAPKKKI